MNKSKSPLFTIGIVTFNSENIISDCLRNIYASTEHDIKILVFDNASTDSTIKIIEHDFPLVEVIKSESNFGFGYGVNKLIDNSKSEFILIMNPDVYLNKSTMEPLLETMNENEKCVVCAPGTLDINNNPENNARRFPTIASQFFESILGGRIAFKLNKSEQIKLPEERFGTLRVEWIKGAIWLIRKSVFINLGKMRNDFFLYSEETEFAKRAYLQNYEFLIVSESNAQHIGGDSDTNPTLYSLLAMNKLHSARIHKQKLYFAIARLIMIVGSILRFRSSANTKLRKVLFSSFRNFEDQRQKLIFELNGKISKV